MIQMDFYDHYFNGTLDTVMALKFTLNAIKIFDLDQLEFLMIADDDTFIHIDILAKYLMGSDPIMLPVSDNKYR